MDTEQNINQNKKRNLWNNTVPLSLAIIITFNAAFGAVIIQNFIFRYQLNNLISYKEYLDEELANTPERKTERLRAELFPEEGVNLGIRWEDLGQRLVEEGVIDEEKFLSLFKFEGERSEYRDILDGSSEYIVLNEGNSRFILNTLWALGLAQNSQVLMNMQNNYGDVATLASTGGWSIGKFAAMESYGKSNILELNDEQQRLIVDITKNIYRPCCNNPTSFADCNHGMAMLGLVELMVANGFSEDEIYDMALAFNTYWFPDTYLTIADFFETTEGIKWKDVDSRIVLSSLVSSGSGFRAVKSQVTPLSGSGGGGGCSV